MPAKPWDAVSGGMIGMEWKRASLTRVSRFKTGWGGRDGECASDMVLSTSTSNAVLPTSVA